MNKKQQIEEMGKVMPEKIKDPLVIADISFLAKV